MKSVVTSILRGVLLWVAVSSLTACDDAHVCLCRTSHHDHHHGCSCHHHSHKEERLEGARQGESDGAQQGRDAGLDEGYDEGFETGAMDRRTETLELLKAPACCRRSEFVVRHAEDSWRALADESPHYVDAYDVAYSEAYREAYPEAFDEGYLDGYLEGYAKGEVIRGEDEAPAEPF